MRVGVYYRSFAFHGGGPRVAVGIAKSLAELGYQPAILTNEYDTRIWPDLKNMRIISTKVSPSRRLVLGKMDYVANTLYLLAQSTRELDAIILTGMYLASPFVKILSDIPLILYIHCAICTDWTINQTLRHFIKGIERKTYRSADFVLCNSKITQKTIKSQLNLDAEVLYPRIDTEYFRPDEGWANNLVVSVCRLDPKKQSERMINLFNSISGDYRFILAGGVEKKHTWYAERLARLANSDDRVSLVQNPSQDLVRELYQRAAVFWYIYPLEDFGLPVAEAMSCGTPAVVIKGGGLQEIVADGSGFLAQSKEEFVDRTLFLLEHPHERQRMGTSARNHVLGNFSDAVFTKRLKTILEKFNSKRD